MLLQVKVPAFKKKVPKNPNLFGAGGQLLFGTTEQQDDSNSDSDDEDNTKPEKTQAKKQPRKKKTVKPNLALLLFSVQCCCFQCSTLQYAVISSASPLEATTRVVVGLVLPRHEFPL